MPLRGKLALDPLARDPLLLLPDLGPAAAAARRLADLAGRRPRRRRARPRARAASSTCATTSTSPARCSPSAARPVRVRPRDPRGRGRARGRERRGRRRAPARAATSAARCSSCTAPTRRARATRVRTLALREDQANQLQDVLASTGRLAARTGSFPTLEPERLDCACSRVDASSSARKEGEVQRFVPAKLHGFLDFMTVGIFIAGGRHLPRQGRAGVDGAVAGHGARRSPSTACSPTTAPTTASAAPRVISMKRHLQLDAAFALSVGLSPWVFGTWRKGWNYWAPQTFAMSSELFFALTTKLDPE